MDYSKTAAPERFVDDAKRWMVTAGFCSAMVVVLLSVVTFDGRTGFQIGCGILAVACFSVVAIRSATALRRVFAGASCLAYVLGTLSIVAVVRNGAPIVAPLLPFYLAENLRWGHRAAKRLAVIEPRGADIAMIGSFPREIIERGGPVSVTYPRPLACDLCGGTGCKPCRSSGRATRTETAGFTLPPRSFGETVRLKGHGGVGLQGSDNGDLFIEIHVEDTGTRDWRSFLPTVQRTTSAS